MAGAPLRRSSDHGTAKRALVAAPFGRRHQSPFLAAVHDPSKALVSVLKRTRPRRLDGQRSPYKRL